MVKDFEKSGFKGSLNRYRAQEIDWIELQELDKLTITPPAFLLEENMIPLETLLRIMIHTNMRKICENFKGSYIIKQAGHWVQQEKPKEVNQIIKNF